MGTSLASRCRTLTGFPPLFIHQLGAEITELMPPRRGKASKMSTHDALVCILILYRTGLPISSIAATLRLQNFLVSDRVSRIRPFLNSALKARHSTLLLTHRPLPFAPPPNISEAGVGVGPNLLNRDIALAVDCTPAPINKPAGRTFESNKFYYDAHHGLYAMKVEVAVSTTTPHYALFWSKLWPGAKSDIEVDRAPDGAASFSGWLTKTPSEIAATPGCSPYWGAVYDSGFAGEVPGLLFPRSVLLRPSVEQTALTKLIEAHYKRRRVVVEQFFGRMKRVFTLSAKPYNYDPDTHPIDIANIIMLTNESITLGVIAEDPDVYYTKWLNLWMLNEERKREKHAAEQRKWRGKVSSMFSTEEDIQRIENGAPPHHRPRLSSSGDDSELDEISNTFQSQDASFSSTYSSSSSSSSAPTAPVHQLAPRYSLL